MSRKPLEDERLLTTDEAAEYIRMSASFLHKARVHGGGPCFVKIGRSVFYRPRDLDEWLASLVRNSTSDTVETRRKRETVCRPLDRAGSA